jgi:tRNA-2-methylthio-N6-dimethylallyladenosine synthase
VLRQVRTLVEGGAKEITLLGQTVNSYRHEEARFSDLLRAVAAVDGLERVRFTSPYPVDFSADVIAAIAEEPKIAKHVHMPLQSGSDDVLARMKRGYTYADFVSLAAALRQVPGIAITTDILVGFSGETDDDHRQTLAAMDELHFDHAFMFAYSEREGTAAARRLPDDIPEDLKRTRLEEVIRKQEGLSAAANAAYVGKIEDVLFHATSRRSDAELVGRTSSFKAVIVPRKDKAPGDLAKVRITRATSATLYGDLT